jgi:hypothetical protein
MTKGEEGGLASEVVCGPGWAKEREGRWATWKERGGRERPGWADQEKISKPEKREGSPRLGFRVFLFSFSFFR